MEEKTNINHHHSTHKHHHDDIHEFRKHSINRIQRRKLINRVAYWSLFFIALLSVIAVFVVYTIL